jgi:ferredoxin-type protein NapG
MSDGISRRDLVKGGVGAAALLAVGGTAKYAFGSTPLLRPPGGQDEDRFIGNCIKCDRCRSACPLSAIGVANLNDGLLNARTPKMNYRTGSCDFCNLCIENCPTGALVAFNPEKEWIGPAVIDPDECIAFAKRGGCRICVDQCPFDAITLDDSSRPVVNLEKCNGCGLCENICPSHSYRAYSGSSSRGINIEHTEDLRP